MSFPRPTEKSFHVFSFDDIEEKVALTVEGERGQDPTYKITLCNYLDMDNGQPIGSSIRFLRVAHPV